MKEKEVIVSWGGLIKKTKEIERKTENGYRVEMVKEKTTFCGMNIKEHCQEMKRSAGFLEMWGGS